MNLKLPIKVSEAQADSIVEYFKSCGHEVRFRPWSSGFHSGAYFTQAPNYGETTPLIERGQDSRGRTAYWFYLRLPSTERTK